jgi:hypothetical protein
MQPPPKNPDDHGAWSEYRRLVITELIRLDTTVQSSESRLLKELKETRNEVTKVRSELSALQAKAGILGFVAGLAASLGAAFLGRS